jgi:hypothetical protein
MERGDYLNAYRSKKISTFFKAERTFHEITYTPSTAKPGDTLSVDLPRVKDLMVVPGTFALTFDMDIVLDPTEPGASVNTYPVNNLAANIISQYVIKIGSETVYDLDHAHLYNTFADLWLTEKQRTNAVFQGIQDEPLRKMRSDLKATLSNPSAANVAFRKIFGRRYIIPLKFELLDNHIPLPTDCIVQDVTFELTINKKENVLKYAKADTANFTMKNICLQYETIRDDALRQEIERGLDIGTIFLYDHIHHYKREEITKKDTFLNVDIRGVDRRSLKGVLLLFQEEFTAGQRDSEKFVDPNITNVKFTIDDIPNKVYNTGYRNLHQWEEIVKHFVPEELKKSQAIDIDMSLYHGSNKFGLWVDLRSTEDNNLHGSGKRHEAKSGLMMEITKRDLGDGKHVMHIFIVSDARVIFNNKKMVSIEK